MSELEEEASKLVELLVNIRLSEEARASVRERLKEVKELMKKAG